MTIRQPRILCLASDEDSSLMLTILFSQAGYKVVAVGTVREALELARSERFDLYFVDDYYPDGTGYDFARHVHGRGETTPLIFQSANGYPHDIAKGYKVGASAYLIKPVDLDVLLGKVRELTQTAQPCATLPGQ
jgi:DNA-binding response OmpR family regulator